MSHPGQGLDRFQDLPKASTYFLGNDAFVSVFQWLQQSYGFSPDKVKPYTFNSAPFVADMTSIQQGYATSEPFAIEQEAGFKPNVFLAADYGYQSYSTTIETRRDVIAKIPISCSASSMPRSSAGIIISMATIPPQMRSSRKTIPT